jgi:NDP-sugar pyrophosphorylase family protein
MDRVLIGDGTTIQDSIIGRHVNVKSSRLHPTWILGVSVIGDDVVIGEGCVLTETRVYPHRVIPDEQRIANQIIE